MSKKAQERWNASLAKINQSMANIEINVWAQERPTNQKEASK